MATIGRVNGASFNNTPRLSYIATAAFNTYFYSYSTSINASLVTVGTLGPVTGATAGNCPAGRVLRENGRKLYPGANPDITTYLVGVYDAQTMLSGFIDPNAAVFQIYNTDKPTYLQDGVEPTANTTDRGPSIFTRGNILGGGNLDISGSAVFHSGTTAIGYGSASGSTVTQGAGSGKGTGVTLDTPTGAITMNNAALASGATVAFTLTCAAIGANDVIVVNHSSAGTGGSYTVAVSYCTTGSAIIRVTNVSGGSLGEAIVLSYVVIAGSSA